MYTLTLDRITHRNTSQISVGFEYNASVKDHIKAFKGVRWSQTHRCFYFEDTRDNLHHFFKHIQKKSWYLN
ncbi:hypothetical protein [Leeuwenhoekiella marinoflava]|uniref:Uncharacterized protein n=2 Tax=Leeuwenhoekiella marinoflava TaxID=988 RepID=A0A4Q0PF61_9FLAO|nr:hypothetical protein [Leeuwenhoekiella marinoflava]RXG25441.1 hypothetical protein DSL99_3474 [Leeuwenhoekiella marinoflava]SHF86961.1 hypothetical protein SAMN02745246_03612 [Leeuwenhoekiella marinoflava DSM 3653]